MNFNKRAYAPFYYNIARHLGELCDSLTGLIMLPFGRYGTAFALKVCEGTLIWQMKNRGSKIRKQKNELVQKGRSAGS
jgi:hypothetical protein